MGERSLLTGIVLIVLAMIFMSPRVSAAGEAKRKCRVERLNDGNYHIFDDRTLMYSTNNFDICASSGASLERIAARNADCVTFAKKEDAFLALEREAVCEYRSTGECNSVKKQMLAISKEIKEMFTPEQFSYHDVHIEMGALCTGSAPSSKFTTEALCTSRHVNNVSYVKRV